VTRDDLREIKTFEWLQQAILGIGTFFFSGAFWLFVGLLAHQEKFEVTAWIGMCFMSMLFGAVLVLVSTIIYYLKQKRLDKYFETN
jgi:hypothetical protein